MISIRKVELPVPGLERLQSEARDEGYDFIETLVDEWASASNRFDAPGEALCGHLDQGLLVAVGGLNCDPLPVVRTWAVSAGSTSGLHGVTRALGER
jgi:hypothetical protein